MSVETQPLLHLENTYARDLEGLYQPWQAAGSPAPQLLALNEDLAAELGLDPPALASPDGLAILAGNAVPEGATSIAQAYSGHQFGGFSPRLGDGRALLLGELIDTHGRRRDVHLKGSGRTPYARGADGKAAIGPMLRELVIGEAMHALGIPTTRALAVVATGEPIMREAGPLPGAILVRVAASHLRVGTFQYVLVHGDADLLRRLADYAIARHHPQAAEADDPYLALFEAVLDAQARLIAQWMLAGFIHGVMNTDNMTISGETIDYGPCAFMDAYEPSTVYSSIDQAGRYAYGNQPAAAQWNLARFAESLLPLLGDDSDAAIAKATQVLTTYPERYRGAWRAGMRDKLGLLRAEDGDVELFDDLLGVLQDNGADWTSAFRALATLLRGDAGPARALLVEPADLDAWAARWLARLDAEGRDRAAVADAMDAVNPLVIPRNHLVEEALTAATGGDLAPLGRLLEAVREPYAARPGFERYAEPAPAGFAGDYRTFCGT